MAFLPSASYKVGLYEVFEFFDTIKSMKTVIISGVSKGLGLVIASSFSKKGWQVIGTGRSIRPNDLDSAIDYHQFDASNIADCQSFWESISGRLSGNDICLVNNAGSYIDGNFISSQPKDYFDQMQSNYFSAVNMTHGLTSAADKAKIFNIISSSALASHPGNSAYGAAKTAEKHFFQTLQIELKPSKYQITNLYPSYIASDVADTKQINPKDIASLIINHAEENKSYYLKDITLYPKNS